MYRILLALISLSVFCAARTDNRVVVIPLDDTVQVRGSLIGKTKMKYRVISRYNNLVVDEKAKQKILNKGGNLIIIRKHGHHSPWTGKSVVEGDVYKVNDVEDYVELLEWSEKRQLKASDFRGVRPDKDTTGDHAHVVVIIRPLLLSSGLLNNPEVAVLPFFIHRTSWILPDAANDSLILQHAQKNFDLCEIAARKLYRDVKSEGNSAHKPENTKILTDSINAQLTRTLKLHKTETEEGKNRVKQAEWNKRIADELDSLKAYVKHY